MRLLTVNDFYDLLAWYGIPKRVSMDLRLLKDSLPDVSRYMPTISKGEGFYIHGPTGTGKTVLAAWILASYLRAKIGNGEYEIARANLLPQHPDYAPDYAPASAKRYRFMTMSDILDAARPGAPGDSFEGIKKAAVLVIDDLGAEKTTEWAVDRTDNLITYRYNEMLPTIITSNFTLDELMKVHYAPVGSARIPSRLSKMCLMKLMDGKEYR